jgi:hypothetical protein
MKINRKKLVVGIIIGIAIVLSIIFVLMKDSTTSTYSVTAEDPTKPIPQSLGLANISSCSQTKEVNDSYEECIISNSNAFGIGNLPSPVFKYYVPPVTTYGPGPGYGLVEPTSLLTREQMGKVMDVVRNDPQIKSQSFAWKVYSMDFYPSENSWYAKVFLVIHGIQPVHHLGDCGWNSRLTIDLNDLTIMERENINVTSYEKC